MTPRWPRRSGAPLTGCSAAADRSGLVTDRDLVVRAVAESRGVVSIGDLSLELATKAASEVTAAVPD